jgi:peroxiredoxin
MKKLGFILSAFLLSICALYAQNESVKVGIIGEKFSDFVLKTYQGGEVSLNKLRGKNILLISSRGKYTDSYWCGICYYQYAEFADLQITKNIGKKYDMEILFLLPYSKDTVTRWESNFRNGLDYIEHVKRPADTTKLSKGQISWMKFAQRRFPKTFDYSEKPVPLPLPILLDDKQEVSKGLDILRTEWDGTKTLQNVPTVYFIDKNGILRFKYMSQSTADRPTAQYLLSIIENE